LMTTGNWLADFIVMMLMVIVALGLIALWARE
jgi:hypothetical protein